MVTEKAVDVVDILSNIANIASNMGRNRGAVVAGSTASAVPGFFAKLLDIGITLYRESGGGMLDEMAITQGLFADMNLKNAVLDPTEQRKIIAVIAAMEPHEKVVFRVVLSLMKPEAMKVPVPGKTVKRDGKDVKEPDSFKWEKTGVDPRVNTLKGIAALVSDDLSNTREVAAMLRDAGGLGSQNMAVQAYLWGKTELEKEMKKVFRVERISDITYKMVEDKLFAPEDEADRPVTTTKNPIKWLVSNITPGPTDKVVLVSPFKFSAPATPIKRSRR